MGGFCHLHPKYPVGCGEPRAQRHLPLIGGWGSRNCCHSWAQHRPRLADQPPSHFPFEISLLTHTRGDLRPFPKSPNSILMRNNQSSSGLQRSHSIPKGSLLSAGAGRLFLLWPRINPFICKPPQGWEGIPGGAGRMCGEREHENWLRGNVGLRAFLQCYDLGHTCFQKWFETVTIIGTYPIKPLN